MRILLANPRGFCAGVNRALNIVEYALKIYHTPIYVFHEIVHNRYVINILRTKGVIFIEKLEEVPKGSILIFSAHGVSQIVRLQAKRRNLIILDATCPLVNKVHMKVARASREGIEVILIGHQGHQEVKGTIGQYNHPLGGIHLVENITDVWKLKVKNIKSLCFMTQTTLSIDNTSEIINALYKRFPNIIGSNKNDICYATINRQKAIHQLTTEVDMVLIIGSKNSSNSNRLFELSIQLGKPTYLIEKIEDSQKSWFNNVLTVGISAGASAPDILVQQAIKYLIVTLGVKEIKELTGYKENIVFNIPKKLNYK